VLGCVSVIHTGVETIFPEHIATGECMGALSLTWPALMRVFPVHMHEEDSSRFSTGCRKCSRDIRKNKTGQVDSGMVLCLMLDRIHPETMCSITNGTPVRQRFSESCVA
jgi:hypothetical protein